MNYMKCLQAFLFMRDLVIKINMVWIRKGVSEDFFFIS